MPDPMRLLQQQNADLIVANARLGARLRERESRIASLLEAMDGLKASIPDMLGVAARARILREAINGNQPRAAVEWHALQLVQMLADRGIR